MCTCTYIHADVCVHVNAYMTCKHLHVQRHLVSVCIYCMYVDVHPCNININIEVVDNKDKKLP